MTFVTFDMYYIDWIKIIIIVIIIIKKTISYFSLSLPGGDPFCGDKEIFVLFTVTFCMRPGLV